MQIIVDSVTNHRLKKKIKTLSLRFIILVGGLSLFILLTSCSIDPNGWMGMYFPEDGEAITLEWNPNNESDLGGYKIYYGIESGVYIRTADVGMSTTSTISNLAQGVTYYFTATAYNIMGYESGFSQEIEYKVPNT
jgi:hypothetical protein